MNRFNFDIHGGTASHIDFYPGGGGDIFGLIIDLILTSEGQGLYRSAEGLYGSAEAYLQWMTNERIHHHPTNNRPTNQA